MKFKFQLLMLCFAFLSFASCKQTSGEKADVSDAAEVAEQQGVDYAVDVNNSMLNWEGSKPTATHTGTINLNEGSISVSDGKVTGGSFTIDMNSIVVTDLEGDQKAYLESHLKGDNEDKADDFFNVKKYPTATFEITKVTDLVNDPEATHLVYGNLTLKETVKEVGFKANVQMQDGTIMVNTPAFTIDRTQWGIKYGSPSFFENLKDKAISNDIGLTINLTATAPAG
jgi:polyisoprenoid-binding protein YceI